MKDLIEALNIFLKYGDKTNPSHCEHDVLYIDCDPSHVQTRTRNDLMNSALKMAPEPKKP